jgi:type II secretory pathway component PulF
VNKEQHPRTRRSELGLLQQWRIESALLEVSGWLVPLLQAGVPISDALAYAATTPMGRLAKAYAHALRTAVQEGQWLAEVWSEKLPVLYHIFLMESQYSGALDASLSAWQRVVLQRREWWQSMLKICSYPLFLCLLTACLLTYLVRCVIPTFQALYVQLGANPGRAAEVLVACAQIGVYLVWLALICGATAAVLLPIVAHYSPHLWERMVRRARLFRVVRDRRVHLLCLWLGSLVQAGVPVVDALRALSGEHFPLWVRRTANQALERCLSGKGLTEAFAAESDPLFEAALRTAEQTGELAEALLRVQDIYQVRLKKTVSRILRWLEPLLLVTVGTMVAGSMALLFIPMYDVIGQISEGGHVR